MVLLIYRLNATLAWFAPQVTNEPGWLEQACHPLLSQGSALAFLGMNLGCSFSWGSGEWPLELLLLIIPTVPVQLKWEWEDPGPGGELIILLHNES